MYQQAWRREDTSYAKVLGGNTKSQEARRCVGLCYSPDPVDKELARKCFTGILKEEYPWQEVEKLINELCGEKIRVSYSGGDVVIFHLTNKGIIRLADLECF